MGESVDLLIERVKSQKYHCLNISHRDLTVLPQSLGNLCNLRILLANDNVLALPPTEIIPLAPSLEKLVLDGNKFTILPNAIGTLKKLILLSVSRTTLGALCPGIGNLLHLQELWLNDCSLLTLPKEIGSLKNLVKVGLRKNKLQEIPKEFGKLKLLRWSSFAENYLSELPREFSCLQELRYADFSHNRFEVVPSSLCDIVTLKVILLKGNNISFVSDDVLLSTALMVKVDLRNNPMIKKPDHWKGMEFILIGEGSTEIEKSSTDFDS